MESTNIVLRDCTQSGKNSHCLILSAFQDEPPGRLWQIHHGEKYDKCEEDLECDWESPGYSGWFEERKTKIKPVAETNTTGDERALGETSQLLHLSDLR